MSRTPRISALPSRDDILAFVRASPTAVDRKAIARAFRVKGDAKTDLKELLRKMEAEGLLDRGHRRRLAEAGSLPEVTVVDVVSRDSEGDLIGRPATWTSADEPPRIIVDTHHRGAGALAPGVKILARLRRLDAETYAASPIRILSEAPERLLAVVTSSLGRIMLTPVDRREKDTWLATDLGDADPGDLVAAMPLAGRRGGLRQARVVERVGRIDDPHSFSLIAIHTFGLPHVFPEAAEALANTAEEPTLAGREDLREIPLVTIDGEDARDFDDAVWAEPDTDPENPGGWHIMVAIADVAWYVRPGDALDREARERGNSVYFPDRVVPMLPEALSNGLCSLRPNENRACLAVHIWIDAKGHKRRHRFVRGLMRSAARLTYRQVQDAIDGSPDDTTGPLLDPVVRPLFGAFEALDVARRRRGTLELDLVERKVILDRTGVIEAVLPRERLASHRLIEEYMIAANVAAAETLTESGIGCLYRIHAKPDAQKVEALRTFLSELDIGMQPGPLTQPKQFTALLKRVADGPFASVVNDLVLRSQAQAVYSPENIGHFGLALKHYAHFTSPIRRYSDLLVHRALIAALKLGEGALPVGGQGTFTDAGEHLSMTERRAAAAERATLDRFAAAYLAQGIGKQYAGRIGGVTRFGLFVRIEEVGVDGFVPVGSLGTDFYDHDAARHMLVGRRTGQAYRLGEPIAVRVSAADPITGSIVLNVLGDTSRNAPRVAPRGRYPRSRRR